MNLLCVSYMTIFYFYGCFFQLNQRRLNETVDALFSLTQTHSLLSLTQTPPD